MKNSRALPRSRSHTTMASEMSHMASSGRSMRRRGILMPSTVRTPMLSSSRFSERKLARKTMTSTLASSPGWKLNRPNTLIHSLAPDCSKPTKMGRTSSTTPRAPRVYL